METFKLEDTKTKINLNLKWVLRQKVVLILIICSINYKDSIEVYISQNLCFNSFYTLEGNIEKHLLESSKSQDICPQNL